MANKRRVSRWGAVQPGDAAHLSPVCTRKPSLPPWARTARAEATHGSCRAGQVPQAACRAGERQAQSVQGGCHLLRILRILAPSTRGGFPSPFRGGPNSFLNVSNWGTVTWQTLTQVWSLGCPEAQGRTICNHSYSSCLSKPVSDQTPRTRSAEAHAWARHSRPHPCQAALLVPDLACVAPPQQNKNSPSAPSAPFS